MQMLLADPARKQSADLLSRLSHSKIYVDICGSEEHTAILRSTS